MSQKMLLRNGALSGKFKYMECFCLLVLLWLLLVKKEKTLSVVSISTLASIRSAPKSVYRVYRVRAESSVDANIWQLELSPAAAARWKKD